MASFSTKSVKCKDEDSTPVAAWAQFPASSTESPKSQRMQSYREIILATFGYGLSNNFGYVSKFLATEFGHSLKFWLRIVATRTLYFWLRLATVGYAWLRLATFGYEENQILL